MGKISDTEETGGWIHSKIRGKKKEKKEKLGFILVSAEM